MEEESEDVGEADNSQSRSNSENDLHGNISDNVLSNLCSMRHESDGTIKIVCNYCKRKFLRESSYKRHLQTHLQDPIKCEYCGRVCPKKSVLIKHLRTHTGEKPYECDVCELQFATKPSLDYHLAVHKGERPFVCSYCGKGFIQNSHLTRHLRVHTGEKPYCCTYCDMKFSRQGSLQVHLRRHTGEVLFTCTHCDRKFTNESTFKYHLKKLSGHKPYVCFFCGWSFISSSHLRKHERVHLGKKNAEDIKQERIRHRSCSVPGSDASEEKIDGLPDSIASKDELTSLTCVGKSVKVRTTTRNYHCPYCPLKFIRRSALQSHLTFHEAQTRDQQHELLYKSSTIKSKNENDEEEPFAMPVLCSVNAEKRDWQTLNRESLSEEQENELADSVSSCHIPRDDNDAEKDSDGTLYFSDGEVQYVDSDTGEVRSVHLVDADDSVLSCNRAVKSNNRSSNRKNPFPRKLIRKS